MGNNLKRIFNVLDTTSIPVEKQKRLLGFLSFTSDQNLEPIADQFERTPEFISSFLDIIEKKFAALTNRDAEVYKRAVEAELAQIKG